MGRWWTLAAVSGCVQVYGPALQPSFVDAAPPTPHPADTFARAVCRADPATALALAADDDERGLAHQLEGAFVGGPDVAWLQGWLSRHPADALLTPFVQSLLVSHAGLRGQAAQVTTVALEPVDRAELDAMALLPPFSPPVPAEPLVLPLRRNQVTGLPMVKVAVGGEKPRWFFVDTGAGISVASDRSVPADLAVAARALTLEGVGDAQYDLASADLALGGLTLPSAPLAVLDHRTLTFRLLGIPIVVVHGILGWPVLSRYRVAFDAAAGTLTLSAPHAPAPDPNLFWSGAPYVRGGIDGEAALLMLDTGAVTTTLLAGARDDGIPLPEGWRHPAAVDGVGDGGIVEVERIPGPRTFQVGGASLVAGDLDALPEVFGEHVCADGWIGSDAFRGVQLVVDASAGEVVVLPSGARSP